MVATAPYALDRRKVRYHPWGEGPAFLSCKDKEALYEGPAGTGKSYACLWKIHAAMLKYPGSRALMVRKTLVSLTASALVTFVQRVLTTGNYAVTFFGGSKAEPAQFRYPNGSRIVVGGMDNPSKIMSAEYDMAFVNEATELTENDWESITTRLRFGAMPYQQLIADCNPAAPSHWLNQRANLGIITRFGSRHEDNPTLWDHERGAWTERGTAYMNTLDRLTGVRYQRLRLGQWVAAEGQVYDTWRDDVHLVSREDVADRLASAWYFGTADWGWTNPGCLQIWAVDHDNRLILVAEHYHTRKPMESWWVPQAVALTNRYNVVAWACDPSEPQYIAQFNAAGLNARGAVNDLLPGITAVQNRLNPAGDGVPRLQIVRGALIERDEALVEAKQPWCTEQEIPEYVWAKNVGGQTLKDKPVDANNHGLDTMRYAVAHLDLGGVVGEIDPFLRAAFDLPR
jgi:PBSX family phage terminase large subunit